MIFLSYLENIFPPNPEHGLNFWNHLDEIVCLLEERVQSEQIHTIFISLSWGAKVVSTELSRRTGVRCFDLGSMMLGLTYSASPGVNSRRNCHFPYFYRVPLVTYLQALRDARPDLPSSRFD